MVSLLMYKYKVIRKLYPWRRMRVIFRNCRSNWTYLLGLRTQRYWSLWVCWQDFAAWMYLGVKRRHLELGFINFPTTNWPYVVLHYRTCIWLGIECFGLDIPIYGFHVVAPSQLHVPIPQEDWASIVQTKQLFWDHCESSDEFGHVALITEKRSEQKRAASPPVT